jgi:hypothetical protein
VGGAQPRASCRARNTFTLARTQGREYSCYTLAHEGRVVAHADTAAALSNLNYAYAAHPGVRQWVDAFVTRSGVSGQARAWLRRARTHHAARAQVRTAVLCCAVLCCAECCWHSLSTSLTLTDTLIDTHCVAYRSCALTSSTRRQTACCSASSATRAPAASSPSSTTTHSWPQVGAAEGRPGARRGGGCQ